MNDEDTEVAFRGATAAIRISIDYRGLVVLWYDDIVQQRTTELEIDLSDLEFIIAGLKRAKVQLEHYDQAEERRGPDQ